MRCDSPPDSVVALRDRFRYPSPTFVRKPSRARISLRIWCAISASRSLGRVRAKNASAVFDRHRGDVVDVLAGDRHAERLGLETRAVAHLARRRRHVLLDLFLDVVARGLAVAALQVVDDAFELRLVLPRVAAARFVRELLLLVGAVEDRLDESSGSFSIGVDALHAPRAQQALDLLHVVRVHRRDTGRCRAFFDHGTIAPSAIDFVRSGITFHGSISIFTPRPLHAGTRAVRRVEREQPRLELLERDAAVRARERFAERRLRPRVGRPSSCPHSSSPRTGTAR